jgi:hypothetical protein
MMLRVCVTALAGVLLSGCVSGPRPATVADIASAHDWQNEPGASLNAGFQADMLRLLKGLAPESAAATLREAQYECEVGDATACNRSFATRACQMDWTVAFPTNGGAIRAVAANFRRDCVGRTGDWPEARNSAIDDQVAPAPAF